MVTNIDQLIITGLVVNVAMFIFNLLLKRCVFVLTGAYWQVLEELLLSEVKY